MKSSWHNSRKPDPVASLATSQLFLTPVSDDVVAAGIPGSFNDDAMVRGVISASIKHSGKTREVIAEEMTYLIGAQVTKRALDSYTSESAEQNRFPTQYMRAFCQVTNDWSLIRCVLDLAGLHTISATEQKLLELGKQYLAEKKASAAIKHLEDELSGSDL